MLWTIMLDLVDWHCSWRLSQTVVITSITLIQKPFDSIAAIVIMASKDLRCSCNSTLLIHNISYILTILLQLWFLTYSITSCIHNYLLSNSRLLVLYNMLLPNPGYMHYTYQLYYLFNTTIVITLTHNCDRWFYSSCFVTMSTKGVADNRLCIS